MYVLFLLDDMVVFCWLWWFLLFTITRFGWELFLILILFKPWMGYLHFGNTSCRSSSSFSKSCRLKQMTLHLWLIVLTTLYTMGMVWWLSNYRYWAVWMSFLHNVVAKVPSGFGMTSMSKNSTDPSAVYFPQWIESIDQMNWCAEETYSCWMTLEPKRYHLWVGCYIKGLNL